MTEPFQAIAITGAERERIVAAYRASHGRLVDSYFRRTPDPADHPVFGMDRTPDLPARR